MTRVTCASLLLAPLLQAQDSPPTCAAPPHVQMLHRLRDLPPSAREALQAKLKDIVDSNQPFDATDVVMHGAHFNRFAFAWQARARTIVATEHGGIAYWNALYVVTVPPIAAHSGPLQNSPAQITEAAHAQPSTLCSTMQHILSDPQHTAPTANAAADKHP